MTKLPSGGLLKNTKLKTFFLFVLLATLFWVLTKFSREYTATAGVNINYSNLPKATFLSEENLDKISFDLTKNGFEFFIYKLSNPSININVSQFYTDENSPVIVSRSQISKLIKSQMDADNVVNNISINELHVKLDKLKTKRVAVKPNAEFTFSEGFKQLDSLKVTPDSVTVSGPSNYLDSVEFVETVPYSEEKIDKSIATNISLQPLSNKYASIDPKEVELILDVEEFSQQEMILPIELVNAPSNMTVKLIPSSIKVSFNASLSKFKTITKENFKIVCDFSERNDGGNFMTPKVLFKPQGILDIELHTRQIDYLIFK